MIVSHKNKFIFIKTIKTAGTSIEIALSKYCGSEDIITPISPEDELIRASMGIYPQNYVSNQGTFQNHMGAAKIKRMVGEKVWNTYYKFCFDRNPWDKVISLYYYMSNSETESFSDFMNSTKFKLAYNYPKYTVNNQLSVDYVGKYENLEEELEKVMAKLNIPFDGWLPKAKGKYRKDRQHYNKIYTNSQKDQIREYYQKEILLHGYKF